VEIIEVNKSEYSSVIKSSFHVFGAADFNQLNEDKCDKVHYLLFKDSKYRLGIIGGVRNNIFYSPFSAPFGGFSYLQEDVRLNCIEEAILALIEWTKSFNYLSINITLPPFVYQESFLSKCLNCFLRNSFKIEKIDLNYSFELVNFNDNYIPSIWHNARKNLNRSFSANFKFSICNDESGKAEAYEIIRKNREIRGFPLRMSFSQVVNTAEIVRADFFILRNDLDKAIASAVVFHVSPEIVQVVYWGDLPEFSNLKTMNYLSFKVFEFYKLCNKNIVDIGPSTENSVPNYGLCEFKESIGCEISSKFNLTYKI
jgi:hypothetical protein